MRLLLLGVSDSMLPLLLAVRDSEQFSVHGWHDSDAFDPQLRGWFPGGRRLTLEAVSKEAGNSAIVVAEGGDPSQREAALRDLARDGVPLILVQPACSAIFSIELDMIQRDTGAPMIPIHAGSLHPAVDAVAAFARQGDTPVGRIEQIVLDRNLHDRSELSIRQALSRDALLLRKLLGEFRKVGAMQASAGDSATLSVHVTGVSDTMARWSVGPADGTEGAVLSLVGQTGRISLQMPEAGEWVLQPTLSDLGEVPEHDPAEAMLGHITRGLSGEPISPSWEDAFRATDLADVAFESVRRGKTLTVNNERLTEEDTFKGMMSAGGCLILLLLPVLLVFVSLLDGLQIPFAKETAVHVGADRRTVNLPPDLESIDSVRLVESDRSLRLLTVEELNAEFSFRETGTPQAFSVSRTEITLAPVPDSVYELSIRYKGSFSIWRGWPLILLLPIACFLALQLLKLVFVKPVES